MNSDSKWVEYIRGLESTGALSGSQAGTCVFLWWEAQTALGSELPFPHTGPSPSGSIIMAWDSTRHHVDIEVLLDGTFEWFYRDREAGHYGC